MSYTPQAWVDGSAGNTPISAARLLHIEQGIADAHALDGMVNLKASGAMGNGIANDTAALQAAITAAGNSARLYLPAGVYLVDGLTLLPNQWLSGPSGMAYVGPGATTGARLRARTTTQTAPVLTVATFSRVSDLAVEAQSTDNTPCVRPNGGLAQLQRVTMTGGSVGFDANYVGGQVLDGCQIHDNAVGVRNLVDSMMTNCVLNVNGEGLSLLTGANDNMIVGNKIEWNTGHGVVLYQAENTTMVGNIIDRAGLAGVAMIEAKHVSISGGVIRRCGKLASATPSEDAQLTQTSCTGVLISGVSTATGVDDDGGGYRSPLYAVINTSGTDVAYTGVDLTGHTSATAALNDGAGVRLGFTNCLGYSPSGTPAVREATITVAAGASGSSTFTLPTLATFQIGVPYVCTVTARNPDTGARSVASLPLLISRESADASVTLGTVTNIVGSNVGVGTGLYQLAATVSTDGSALTVTLNNTSASAAQTYTRVV